MKRKEENGGARDIYAQTPAQHLGGKPDLLPRSLFNTSASSTHSQGVVK